MSTRAVMRAETRQQILHTRAATVHELGYGTPTSLADYRDENGGLTQGPRVTYNFSAKTESCTRTMQPGIQPRLKPLLTKRPRYAGGGPGRAPGQRIPSTSSSSNVNSLL